MDLDRSLGLAIEANSFNWGLNKDWSKFFFLGFDGRSKKSKCFEAKFELKSWLVDREVVKRRKGWIKCVVKQWLSERVILRMKDSVVSRGRPLKLFKFYQVLCKLLMLILLIRARRMCTISSIYVKITNGERESVLNKKISCPPIIAAVFKFRIIWILCFVSFICFLNFG